MYKAIVVTLLSLSVLACSNNVAKVTCSNNNWTDIGYQMATSGKSVREFERYKEQCGTLANTAKDLYLDGYTKGITEFCTYDNGYELGNSNLEIRNICPYEIRANYVRGYNEGIRSFKALMSSIEREKDTADTNAKRAQIDAENAARSQQENR